MGLQQPSQMHIAEHVHVVDQKGLPVIEEPAGSLHTATGVQELLLPGDRQGEPGEAVTLAVTGQKFSHLFGQMVGVDNDFPEALLSQSRDDPGQQGDPLNFHQRLGPAPAQRAQARSPSRCQDHGFHGVGSNSRW